MSQISPSPVVKAYSYVRFSTPEQQQGDSFRRQTKQAEEYAASKGLLLDDTLTLHDLGISGYRGDNITTGKLGYFLECVRSGEVTPGSYLLVESLDRISRQSVRPAMRALEDIVDAGVRVVTMNDGREYSREVLDADPMALIYSILMFMRANEESATKGKRLKAAWAAKRQDLLSKPLTSVVPAWLRLDRESGAMVLIPERAAIVERIFRETLDGTGQHQIAANLNREAIKPWGRGAYWHRSYVAKLLRTEAVIGVFTAHELAQVGGKRVRNPVDRVEGYFPAAISLDLWNEVRAFMQGKHSRARGRHSAAPVTNMLARMATCPKCGGAMTRTNKGSRSRPSYVCAKAKGRAGCTYRSVRVDMVEDAIQSHLPERLRDAPAGERDPQLDQEIINLEGAAEEAQGRIEAILSAIERGGDAVSLVQRLRATEAQYEAARASIRDLEERRASVAGATVHARISRLLEALEPSEGEPSPAAINLALQTVFRRVTIDYDWGLLEFEWQHGGSVELPYRWPMGAADQ